jgi:fatty-acyl-CoA synthase
VLEFYGATEGNVSLLNFDGKTGAIGRIPPYLKNKFPVALVKFDLEAEEPVRGPDGFCIPCAPNEAGEALGQIRDDLPNSRFEGYENPEATKKKILRDVFEKGDAYFRTGDLLKQDEQGYYYFVDRIGDTYRWKGENVATSEVAEVLSVFPGMKEANVYGVQIPGADGRAGMAAIVIDPDDLDVRELAKYLTDELPAYARPIFLRLRPEMEVTGTFKHRKVDLVKEGFDPSTIADPLYVWDVEAQAYIPLDTHVYERIKSGAMNF